MKILLVDKMLYHCYALQKILLKEEFDVLIAQTEEKALKLLEEDGEIDLVLCEQNIEVNGIELYRQCQQLKRYKNCLLYTSPSPRDRIASRMPSSA